MAKKASIFYHGYYRAVADTWEILQELGGLQLPDNPDAKDAFYKRLRESIEKAFMKALDHYQEMPEDGSWKLWASFLKIPPC
jgi:hypothetical protein